MPAIVALFGRTDRFRTEVCAGQSATPDYGAIWLRGSVGLRRASSREGDEGYVCPLPLRRQLYFPWRGDPYDRPARSDHRDRDVGAEQSIMRSYLITRVYALILTLFLLTIIVFALLFMIPGDVVQMIIGAEA